MMKYALLALALLSPGTAPAQSPRKLESYKFDPKSPLESRVQPIPSWLLESWRSADKDPAYQAYQPTPAEMEVFGKMIEAFPAPLKRAMQERLIGFYFISNLRGNGITDWVLDASSKTYAYMILNPAGFRKTMAQVLDERDRSAFKGDPGLTFDVGEDLPGLAYTLPHESTHVYDYTIGLTPYADPEIAAAKGRSTKGGWDIWAGLFKPKPEYAYPARSRLTFFGFGGGPKYESGEACEVYRQLTKSPFASLYGSSNWADDAAELFVFTHLTRTLGRPYRVRCRTADGKEQVFEPLADLRTRERADRILKPFYPPKADLRQKIGQMIMVGFSGVKPDEPWVRRLRKQIKKGLVGSVTLYARNIKSKEQLLALNEYFNSAKPDQPLLISVSQEGGQVQRLGPKNGFAGYKSAKAVAASLNPREAQAYYEEMAQAVSSAGFNLVLAPDVDLDSDAPSPVIGGRERSFSKDPDKVVAYAGAFIDAFHKNRILTCLKHFPGHGRAPGDTHLGMVDTSQTWTEEELRPFYELIRGERADIIMTAHIFNRNIDPQDVATMSPLALGGLLREKGRFDGVIMTDALDMGAIQERYGIEDAVVRAINAGADLLLFPNNVEVTDATGLKPGPDLPERVVAIIEKAVKEGKLSPERIDQSYRRIARLKGTISGRYSESTPR